MSQDTSENTLYIPSNDNSNPEQRNDSPSSKSVLPQQSPLKSTVDQHDSSSLPTKRPLLQEENQEQANSNSHNSSNPYLPRRPPQVAYIIEAPITRAPMVDMNACCAACCAACFVACFQC